MDEVCVGRVVFKDYISGKLLYCVVLDGYDGLFGVLCVGEDVVVGYGVGVIEFSVCNELKNDDGVFDDSFVVAVLDDMMATFGI